MLQLKGCHGSAYMLYVYDQCTFCKNTLAYKPILKALIKYHQNVKCHIQMQSKTLLEEHLIYEHSIQSKNKFQDKEAFAIH